MSQDSTENYDVAATLARGVHAVDTVQLYVSACHQLGYQHQDLTLYPSQVRDGYGTEDGMDLAALQRGCVALEAAAHASQDALAIGDRQFARFSTAWDGGGGDAARNFVSRHADAAAAVSAAVRTAAEALAALREQLWQAVTTKVDTVLAIEGRAGESRAEWLAAATTVTSGVGERSAASELVDGAVKPFVDNSVRTDWLAATQTTVASVTAAYERALSEMAAERLPVFDIPGALGPVWTPMAPLCDDQPAAAPAASAPPAAFAPPAPPAPPAATAPSSWSSPGSVAAPAPIPAVPADPAQAAAPPVPPLGAMGSGMPGMGGGGLSGLGQPFADLLGGLMGGGGGGVGDLPEPDLPEPDLPEQDLPEPDLPEPDLLDAPEDDDPEDDEAEEDEAEEDEAVPAEDVVVADGEDPPEDPCEPVQAPAPTPAPPPAEPLPPPAEPVADEQTPCEIAADEVPQVGEQPE